MFSLRNNKKISLPLLSGALMISFDNVFKLILQDDLYFLNSVKYTVDIMYINIKISRQKYPVVTPPRNLIYNWKWYIPVH